PRGRTGPCARSARTAGAAPRAPVRRRTGPRRRRRRPRGLPASTPRSRSAPAHRPRWGRCSAGGTTRIPPTAASCSSRADRSSAPLPDPARPRPIPSPATTGSGARCRRPSRRTTWGRSLRPRAGPPAAPIPALRAAPRAARDRHLGMLRIVDDREGFAPVALTGEQPVAQPVRGAGPSEALLLRILGGPSLGRLRVQPVEVQVGAGGVDLLALAGPGPTLEALG